MPSIELVTTGDGSCTLYNKMLKTHYHSLHGAVGESIHVYIEASDLERRLLQGKDIEILEIGLGTGLNFILTLKECLKYPKTHVHYTAFEPFPPSPEILSAFYRQTFPLLNFSEDFLHSIIPELNPGSEKNIELNNMSWTFNWEKWIPGDTKLSQYDVVFYDAFGPFTSPELWTEEAILKVYQSIKPGGKMVTFSINSNTRRLLEKNEIRFSRPRGFAAKRQMLVIEK